MTHGASCIIDMSLGDVAESFVTALPIACLVYDHRGFGHSDTRPNAPRQEILCHEQISDMQDAVTFASTLPNIDPERIGIWGFSLAGGHTLHLAHKDRRVKSVIALAPCVDGTEQTHQLVPLHIKPQTLQLHNADRAARAKGEKPMTLPIVSGDPAIPCVLASPESWKFFSTWRPEMREDSAWRNEVTVRSYVDP